MPKIPQYESQVPAPREAAGVRASFPQPGGYDQLARGFQSWATHFDKRLEGIAVGEFLAGKAHWMRRHTEFEALQRQNQDPDTYLDNYDKEVELIKKELEDMTKSGMARQALKDMVVQQYPVTRDAVEKLAFNKRADIAKGQGLVAVDSFERSYRPIEAEAAIRELAESGVITHTFAEQRIAQIGHNIDWYEGLELADTDPDLLLEFADEFYTNLTPEERLRLKNRAESNIAARNRQQDAESDARKQDFVNQFIAAVLDNKLVDPQDVTDALRNGDITKEDAKWITQRIKDNQIPETNPIAYAEVLTVVAEVGAGALSRDKGLSTLYRNLSNLDPTTAKGLIDDFFSAQNKHDAELLLAGSRAMEELIREKTIMGIFTSDERQILAHAEAVIELKQLIKQRIAYGKPLTGTELMAEAVKIGIRKKKQFNEEKEKYAIDPKTGEYQFPEFAPDVFDAAVGTVYPTAGPEMLEGGMPPGYAYPEEYNDWFRVRRVYYRMSQEAQDYIKQAMRHNEMIKGRGDQRQRHIYWREIIADPVVAAELERLEKEGI